MKIRNRCFVSVAAVSLFASASLAQPEAWGTNVLGGGFYDINLATGAATLVGPVGTGVTGLAYDPNSDTLYGVNRNTDMLLSINTSTGAGTAIGSLGINTSAGGLAFDRNTNTMYYNDNTTSSLYSIDTTSGAATLIGPNGLGIMQGLAFDPNSNTLYASTSTGPALYTMNTSTGASTLVGPLGTTPADHGLAFDNSTNTLYMSEANLATNNLYTVNTSTGAATLIGALGTSIQGLAIKQIGLPPCDDPVLLAQAPDQANANRSDLDPSAPFEQADDVAFTQDVIVRSLRWWGLYASADTPLTDDFVLRVYEDAGGVPATSPIAAFHLSNSIRAATGLTTVAFTEYIYAAELPAHLTLEAGKTYWLAIVNDTTADVDDNWFWSTSSVGNNIRVQRTPPSTGTWGLRPTDRAIELCGVPCTLDCAPDLNGDGVVDGADLAGLLASWGVCPAPAPLLAPVDDRRDMLLNTTDDSSLGAARRQ